MSVENLISSCKLPSKSKEEGSHDACPSSSDFADRVSHRNSLKGSFAQYWSVNGADVTFSWQSLSCEQRKILLRRVSPSMPNTPTDKYVGKQAVHGSLLLTPELNLQELCGNDNKLPRLMQNIACSSQIEDDFRDVAYVERLKDAKVLKKPAKLPKGVYTQFVTLLPSDAHYGEVASVVREEGVELVRKMIEEGTATTPDVWIIVLERQISLLETLMRAANEIRSHCADNIECKFGCLMCGRTDTQDGGKLLTCGGCHAASYCSRACQKAHWPEHKSLCKKRDSKTEEAKKTETADDKEGEKERVGGNTDSVAASGSTFVEA